ncbi:MAG: DNA-binding response regulator [Bacteroidales bacterium]
MTAGADAYLSKPFDETELLVRIEKLIELRKTIQNKYRSFSDSYNHKSLDDDFISEAVKLIRNHLTDLQFKTSDIAFALHLSESQLYRKIKALSGRSTALFLMYVRLEEAKKMLIKTNLNISEIAYSCGFNDPAWFSRSFKDEFGYSPSEFREVNKV